MADESTLGLLFDISADPSKALNATTSFRNQASQMLGEFETKLVEVMTHSLGITKEFAIGMGVGIGAVTGLGLAMFELANKAAEVGAKMYEVSEQTGITAENLSGLNAISQLTGGSFDGLSRALGRVTVNLQKAIDAPGAKSSEMLVKLLGGTQQLTELGLKPMGDRMQEVFQHIFAITEEGKRNEALNKLMGRAWMNNVETLKYLAEQGFAPAIEQAKKFGLFYDAEAAAKAKAFDVDLNTLKLTLSSVAQTLGQELIPYISDAILNWNVWLEVLQKKGPWGTAKLSMKEFEIGIDSMATSLLKLTPSTKFAADAMEAATKNLNTRLNADKDLIAIWNEEDAKLSALAKQHKAEADAAAANDVAVKKLADDNDLYLRTLLAINAEKAAAQEAENQREVLEQMNTMAQVAAERNLTREVEARLHALVALLPIVEDNTVAIRGMKFEVGDLALKMQTGTTAAGEFYEMLHNVDTGLTNTTVNVQKQGVAWGDLETYAMSSLSFMAGGLQKFHDLEMALTIAKATIKIHEELAAGWALLGIPGMGWYAAMHFASAAEYGIVAGAQVATSASSGGSGGGGGGYGSPQSTQQQTSVLAGGAILPPRGGGSVTIHIMGQQDHAEYVAGILNQAVTSQAVKLNASHDANNGSL